VSKSTLEPVRTVAIHPVGLPPPWLWFSLGAT
jgi:hypothetical protein